MIRPAMINAVVTTPKTSGAACRWVVRIHQTFSATAASELDAIYDRLGVPGARLGQPQHDGLRNLDRA